MKLLNQAQSAIEQRIKTLNHDEAVLKQSRYWIQAITWGLISTTFLGVAWLAIAKTEEIVVATGKLEPVGSVKEIQMPLGGIAEQILVEDGDRVEAGELLIRLDMESSSQKLKSLQDSLQLKQRQLNLKQLEMKRFKELNREVSETLTEKIVVENEILNRYKMLATQGASSELNYLQQRNTVQAVEGDLRKTKLDGLRQQAVYGQEIQQLKEQIARLNAELTEIKVTLRYQELRSHVPGVVFDLQAINSGYTAQNTETILKIVPFNSLEARVEIPSEKIGFVREGMKTDISIDSFPATDFGVLNGIVMHIGSDALPPNPSQQKSQYRYPASIQLENQQLKLKNGDQLSLQPGMSLSANIKLRKVTYLQMLLGGFQDKANSLKEL